MVTIYHVANESEVSVATVSRVINGSSSVSKKTRSKVMDTIERLGYKPNLLGRNLRRIESKMVLVIVPVISNPFYSNIVKGIEDVAIKNGYNIMICNTNSDISREQSYLELLNSRLAEGVIFMATELSGQQIRQTASEFPVVQCCEFREEVSISHVSIDNYSAAKKAVNYLLELGHREIALVSCKNNFISTAQREKGFKDALVEAGIQFNDRYIAYGDYSFKSGIRAAIQLLNGTVMPTAIFCISDIMAVGTIKALLDKGLKVPEDISVMGFDDIKYASMYNPSLTTIYQPKYDLGCTAMDMLIRQLRQGQKEPEYIYLEYELIKRDSTSFSSTPAAETS